MKRITSIFLIAFILFVPFVLRSQQNYLQEEIFITKQELSGHELLEEITKATEYKFSYSESIITIPEKIELHKTKASIQTFLDEIFKEQIVEYLIEYKTICIRPVVEETINESLSLNEGITLKGKIVDEKTNKAIPYANISICNQPIGLASNEYGEFVFKIPSENVNDNLCVHVIGYSAYTREIDSFNNDKYQVIELHPKVYDLEEISISEKRKSKFNNPKEIVRLAIANIENNYPQQPFALQGYYREYLKHESESYLNMLEAAVVINDKGFSSDFFPYNAQILQTRYNKDFNIVEDFKTTYEDENTVTANFKYIPDHNIPSFGGNELSILFAHDAIRRNNKVAYSFVNKFNEDFILNHTFNLDSIILSDEIPIYCLSFELSVMYNGIRDLKRSKNGLLNTKYKEGVKYEYKHKLNIHGKIMIRSNTWAIERFEYTSNSTNNPKMKTYEVIIDYKNINGKMYLNHLSFSNHFKVFIHPQRTNNLIIQNKEKPIIVNEIFVEKDALTIKFNKSLRKWSCSKHDFIFNGFVIRKNNEESDTIYLQKYPDEIAIIDSNSIILSIPNIQYLVTSFDKKDIEISESEILEYGKATIMNDEILMGNVSLNIDKIKDVSGNRLNELYSIDMYQYREFFVNDILNSFSNPYYSRTIFNNIPIYNQQPKIINDFWKSFNYPTSMPLLGN